MRPTDNGNMSENAGHGTPSADSPRGYHPHRAFSGFLLTGFFALLLSSFALIACRGSAQGTVPATTPTTPTISTISTISTSALPSPTPSPAPITTTTPPESQPLIVTIGLWLPEELDPYRNAPGAEVLARQLNAFADSHTEIQVETVVKKAHGRGGLFDFLRTAWNAAPSVLPDLVVLDVADLESAAAAGLIQPLDAVLPSAALADRFPFAVEMTTVNGQTVGFLLGTDMPHGAYRLETLEAPPLTWQQVLSPPVQFVFPVGGLNREVNDATLIQYLAAGGQMTDAEGNPHLDADALLSVLQFYHAGMGSLALSPTITTTVGPLPISPTLLLNTYDADQAWEQFQAGVGDLTIVRAKRYWIEADDTVALAPIPTLHGHPFSVVSGGWAIAMVTPDPNRQGVVMMLLDWLIAPDRNGAWSQAAGYLPGSRSALREWELSNTDRTTLRGLLDAAVLPPPSTAMETVGRVIQEAVVAVLRGRATPEQAVDAALESMGQSE